MRDSATRRVVIRMDSSARIGTGHIARCHTLARELRGRGARVVFVARPHHGNATPMLEADGFDVRHLPAPPMSQRLPEDGDHRSWVGVPADVDARDTRAAIGQEAVDWLVVDHYGLDAAWEVAMSPHCERMLAIDDLADRPHHADVVLDQNWFGPKQASRYAGLVRESTALLLGPQYALMRPEFAEYRPRSLARSRVDVRRVLVYFGADLSDVTGRALRGLSSPGLTHLDVDVVVSGTYAYRTELAAAAEARGRTTIHGPRPHLADLMAAADVVIGGGGVTTWERMCLGVPSLVVTMAENQEPISRYLDAEGLISLVGSSESVSGATIAESVEGILQRDDLAAWSTRTSAMTDGAGCARVADVMLG